MERSAIEWTESTWNPTVGCTKVSSGCDHCYAERITRRFPRAYPQGFGLTLRPEALDIPLRWRRPRMIFVNSMSDLFHTGVPDLFIAQVFQVMQWATQHTFQILTKRAERLARLAPRLPWPSNVWVGVTIENEAVRWRLRYLKQIPAHVRFLSAEPLLGPLERLDLEGIQWLIAGGESQAGARPASFEWFRDLRDQCIKQDIPFFLKQLGGFPNKRGGSGAKLDNRLWRQMPRLHSEQRALAAELDAGNLAKELGSAFVSGRQHQPVKRRIRAVPHQAM